MDDIRELQEAVKASPRNVPLRRMLAAKLHGAGRYLEAELELKQALGLAPDDARLKISLAEAFGAQDKVSLGLVLLEALTQRRDPPPPARAFRVYADLLYRAGQYADAQEAYDQAVALDPTLADGGLATRINQALRREGPQGEPPKIKLGGGNADAPDDAETYLDVERPRTTFADVGGMEALKEEIRLKIIAPLEHAELYKAYGKKIGGGMLLYGPPGCGKTHLARATAGEIDAHFIAVGISEVLGMYLGESEQNLHALFEEARRRRPCVLFFDEVDALGAKRSDMRQSAGRHLINQFLAEMDGVEHDNEGVLILGATNAPWHLDPAFRRPGRFGNITFVPPPDLTARTEILKLQLRDKPTEAIDLRKVARRTPEFSGADLQAVIDRAIEGKLAEAMRLGRPLPLRTDDLLAAAAALKPSTKEWFGAAKNYALFSNDSGQYDAILTYLKLR